VLEKNNQQKSLLADYLPLKSFTDRPSEKKNAHTHKPEVDREVRKCKAKRTYQW
jgi:hypothetical protein